MLLRVNLVPQKPTAERIKRVSPLILGGLILLLCALFYLRVGHINSQINKSQKEIKIVEETAGLTDMLTSQIASMESQLATLKEKHTTLRESVRKAEGIQAEKNYYSIPLQDISTSLPTSIKCKKISFKGTNGVIDAVAINHQDIPLFISNLKDKGRYSSVEFKDVNKETVKGIDQLILRSFSQ
jgi:Tfp pilus assembly protein PilN